MNYNTTTQIPRGHCTKELQSRLTKLGYETDGSIEQLEAIVTGGGWKLPGEVDEGFGFIIKQKYTRIYLNYVDAIAEEIILLHEFKMIK